MKLDEQDIRLKFFSSFVHYARTYKNFGDKHPGDRWGHLPTSKGLGISCNDVMIMLAEVLGENLCDQ